MIEAFITGSRAYGTPRENSDIDLAVLVNYYAYKMLWAFAAEGKLQFGKLNIVAFNASDPREVERFHKWKKVNDLLVEIRPVTKEAAIQAFRNAGAESAYFGKGKKA